ncbi:MAG: hypothetical protein ACE149_07610 [Armatimonadota bacterium]
MKIDEWGMSAPNPTGLAAALLLTLVKDLAKKSADDVANAYVADATKLVEQKGATSPQDVVRVTIEMVERKQRWSNLIVRAMLSAAGLTRSEIRKRFTEAALAAIAEKHLTDPKAMVAETVALVRDKQGWDSVVDHVDSIP